MILLVEMLSSSFLFPQGVNTTARYGLDFLFCAPLLPLLLRRGILRKGGFRLLTIYFAWCLFTVAYSLVPAYSLGRALSSMLLIASLAVLAFDVTDQDGVADLLRNYLVGCGIIVALVAFAALFLPHNITFSSIEMLDANGRPIPGTIDYASGGISRFVGIFTQPNELGALVIVTIGAALAYWKFASKRGRLLLAALIATAAAFGIAADSRSSMAASMLGVLAFLVWKYRWRGLLACAAVAAALVLAMAFTVGDLDSYVSRGNVASLTGRTDVWNYAMNQVKASPLLGYGYEVEGQIYQLKYFPLWWGPWDEGPRSSLHNDYLSHLVGVGVPATLFWLFIILRPWANLFRQKDDPWALKPIFLLIVLPLLILNCAESGAGDCHYSTGLLFMLCWALAERARLLRSEKTAQDNTSANTAPTLISAIAALDR